MRMWFAPLSYSFSKVDRLILQSGHHYYLDENDECYFMGEYTARRGYNFGETNQLIFNLKKGMERATLPDFRYKAQAIETAGFLLRKYLAHPNNIASLHSSTLVPVPPSKAKDHALYDDRILRILRAMDTDKDLDIRELLIQQETLESFHGDNRLSPDVLATKYAVDDALSTPAPRCIWLFDDVITTGSHFKAAKQVLSTRFPGIGIVGIFIARRVPGSSDL
jgi:hypothetical protein